MRIEREGGGGVDDRKFSNDDDGAVIIVAERANRLQYIRLILSVGNYSRGSNHGSGSELVESGQERLMYPPPVPLQENDGVVSRGGIYNKN